MLDGGVDIVRRNVTSVKEYTSHIFAERRITTHHLTARMKAGLRQLLNITVHIGKLADRHQRRVGKQWIVYAWIRHKICLEFLKWYIVRAIKALRRCECGDNLERERLIWMIHLRSDVELYLSYNTVQIGICGRWNTKLRIADFIQSFVIHNEGHIHIVHRIVCGQQGIIGFNNNRRKSAMR